MLVVGQSAQDRRCAEIGQAVACKQQRRKHLAILEAAAVEQRNDEIGLRTLEQRLIIVRGIDA